ncbi:MAG: DEAD/DEAH box helicase [Candidatus Heimdallarchaeaceae archaeon]
MKCPDCDKPLTVERKASLVDFHCGFCGFAEEILSEDINDAYNKLIEKKSMRKELLAPSRTKDKVLEFSFKRKTDEEKEEMIERGGYDSKSLPSAVKKIINNPDIELIYYKFLKQNNPPAARNDIDLPLDFQNYLKELGINQLYSFQSESFEAINKGENIVIVAPTGTGKTEAFVLPILAKILEESPHPLMRRGLFAIIIYPTKALAKDQHRKILKYGKKLGITCEVYDGDTPQKTRTRIMEYPPNILITNPDMLHIHMKNHSFKDIIRTVKFVIIDEIHVAVGAFGSNLYFILKRLQRIVKNRVQFIGSSATIGNAKEFASNLFDTDVKEIAVKEARKAPTHLLIILPWGVSQYTITSEIARQLVTSGHKTLCFQNSHKNAEIVNLLLQAARIKSSVHRAGLTKEFRDQVETRFKGGDLQALVSTPTLELGIDIGDVDGVVSSIVDITSFIQRIGRAGRKGQESVGALILRNDDPISTFYSLYPETYFDDVRKGYVEPRNEIVSYYQLLASILEKPIQEKEFPEHISMLKTLEENNLIRRTSENLYRPVNKKEVLSLLLSYSIRGIGDTVLIKSDKGIRMGERSMPMAARELFPGAIYLLGGKHYRSTSFNYDSRFGGGEITLEKIEALNLKTSAMRYAVPTIIKINERKRVLGAEVAYCDLKITENVIGYKISEIYTNKLKEIKELEEPIVYSFQTKGFVFTAPHPTMIISEYPNLSEEILMSGTFHALEHVLIESSSMLTGGGSAEIGGISMGSSGAIFVYDAAKGGSGLVKLLYDRLEDGFERSLKILEGCTCKTIDGCPRCTYSYQCGNNNQPLNKKGAIEAIKLLKTMKLELIENYTEYQAYV